MSDAEAQADAHEPPLTSTSPEKATLFGTLVHLWPYIWPSDRADLKMRVVWSMVLLLIAKLATLSVPFTFKWAIDALTGANTAPVEASNWALWLIASPLADDARLWRHTRVDGAAHAMARRHLCRRRHACRAPARLHHLRPHARTVAALPSRAQDRRTDARAGARPLRHRGDRAHGDPAADPDAGRGDSDVRRAVLAVRLALRARDRDHGRRLHVLHLHRHRMADRDPPQDERFRHRGEHQGDRLAAQLRNGEIFRLRKRARPRATTARWSVTKKPACAPIPRSRSSTPARP